MLGTLVCNVVPDSRQWPGLGWAGHTGTGPTQVPAPAPATAVSTPCTPGDDGSEDKHGQGQMDCHWGTDKLELEFGD